MTLTITQHGTWKAYEPDPWPANLPLFVLFCRRESDQVDWYEFVKRDELASETVKMTAMQVDEHWIVQAAARDATQLFPQQCLLLEVDGVDDPDPQASYGAHEYFPDSNTFGPPPQPMYPLSNMQLFSELAGIGLITEDEAVAAATKTALPEPMQAYLRSIEDPKEQFTARMYLSTAQNFARHHWAIEGFFAMQGLTPAQLDAFWRQGLTLSSVSLCPAEPLKLAKKRQRK
jgi:hypothetical protein